jgi:CubicO group peptidase (beta-lactamase class C family)
LNARSLLRFSSLLVAAALVAASGVAASADDVARSDAPAATTARSDARSTQSEPGTAVDSPQRVGERDAAIDAAFDETMRRYELPGLALGVVIDDRVVYTRTAGELVAGEGREITPQTLFKIASNSKAMTTATLARLVDAGKLQWTDPVTRHLPQFRMYDPWVTREMQVRDLLIHNSGLRAGAGDLMLWPEPNRYTRADIINGLAYLKPLNSFRSRYDYDNLLYIVAGEVAAAAGDASYETLVQREVFAPLGMKRCKVGEWRRDVVGDVAQPHMRVDGRNVPVRRDDAVVPLSTSAAAGGIRCSLDDMTTWMRAWLRAEPVAANGKTWLSTAQREAVWTAHIGMPISRAQREWDDTRFSAYGYGWRLSDVDGVLKVAHTGTLMGMYSAVTLLPEKRVGFVMMTNGEGSTARTVLMQTLVKHFTRPESKRTVAYYADWLTRNEALATPAATTPVAAPETRVAATRDDLETSLGIYRDPWFGDVSICASDDSVRFAAAKSPMLTGAVMRVEKRLLVDWDDASVDAEAWLTFATPDEDDAQTLTMAKVDPEADFSFDFEDLAFTRVGDCATR